MQFAVYAYQHLLLILEAGRETGRGRETKTPKYLCMPYWFTLLLVRVGSSDPGPSRPLLSFVGLKLPRNPFTNISVQRTHGMA